MIKNEVELEAHFKEKGTTKDKEVVRNDYEHNWTLWNYNDEMRDK